MLKKIVIIGPESTGKSSLCSALAKHYQTKWCPEYARSYLTKNGSKYSYDDLLIIAQGQLTQEDQLVQQVISSGDRNQFVFIDTDMYVMKVWCEYVFGKCHSFILEQIIKRRYDYYLLCNTDLPWVEDELREYPDENSRKELFCIYKDTLINQATPWVEITGQDEKRIAKAIASIDAHFC